MEHDSNRLDAVIGVLKDFAEHAPTLPIMSDVDMAIMCLRRAKRELEGK